MKYEPYPIEQIEWLREYYPTHTLKETHKAFNEHFGLELTESSIKHRLLKNGIKNNNNTQFGISHKPWNAGIKIKDVRPDLYENYFGRSHEYEHRGSVTRKPVGYISAKKGRNWIKIAEPDVWVQYSRYVYEQHYDVILSDKDRILHLDGDCLNDEIDNLYVVNDGILVRLNKKKLISNEKDITKAYCLQQMLLQEIKEVENANTTHRKRYKKNNRC